MRFFFATDIHGSDLCFKKFLRAADFYGVDALLLGGDYSSKSLVVYISSKNGWQAKVGDESIQLSTRSELENFQKSFSNTGHLLIELDQHQFELFQTTEQSRERFFELAQRERLSRWTGMAAEQLSKRSIPVYHIPGNDEPLYCDEFFNEAPFIPIHRRHIRVQDDLTLLGVGGSNPTPWHTPREFQENEIEAIIESSISDSLSGIPMIFFGHVPPFKSGLDNAPALNPDLSYQLVLGSHKKQPVGSVAIRHAIEQLQPLVGLFGHIHESQGEIRIGKTICVNPGSAYYNGRLQGCVITIRHKEASVQFTEG